MRQIAFTPDAFKEYNAWFENGEIIDRIRLLVRDIERDPFRGLGKPEPLRGKLEWILEPKDKSRTSIDIQGYFIPNHNCQMSRPLLTSG